MKTLFRLLALVPFTLFISSTYADSITHGDTTINMEFVGIGNPGNPASYNGSGAVSSSYRIGKYEVTVGQFESATIADDRISNGDEDFWSELGQSAPAANVSWYEATKYANWLTSGDAYSGVYQFSESGEFIGINRTSALVEYEKIYALPTHDEWYKAAYYRPVDDGTYSRYANGSDNYDPPIGSPHGWNYQKQYYGDSLDDFTEITNGLTTRFYFKISDLSFLQIPDFPDFVFRIAATPIDAPGAWPADFGGEEQNGTYNMMGNLSEYAEEIGEVGGRTLAWFKGGTFEYLGADIASDNSRYGSGNSLNVGTSSYGFRLVEIQSNYSPAAAAGGPYVAIATGWDGAVVSLDGTESYDLDEDPITYEWDLDLSFDSDLDGNPSNDVDEVAVTAAYIFPIGQTEVALVVRDDSGLASDPDITTVTVSPIMATVDIKPDSYPNSINLKSKGVIPVAFLSDETFDALSIDPLSITCMGYDFYDGLVKLSSGKNPKPLASAEDVDGDGDMDLLVKIDTQKLKDSGFRNRTLYLYAMTYEGLLVAGADSVQPVNLSSDEYLFDSGKGTEDDPYIIINADDLQAMKYDLDGHYALGGDIDCSATTNWNDGLGFEPVGSSKEAPFTGILDGRGHSIAKLFIWRPDEDVVGLFGFLDGSEIYDLDLHFVDIIGGVCVGGFAGYAQGSILYQNYVQGALYASEVDRCIVTPLPDSLPDFTYTSPCIGAHIGCVDDFTLENSDLNGEDTNLGGARDSHKITTIDPPL